MPVALSKRAVRAQRHVRSQVEIRMCVSLPRDHASDTTEEAVLALIDADDECSTWVSMPPSIPRRIRAAIDYMLSERYDALDDLDGWLHSSNIVLDGATPFERLALGDGASVLIALGVAQEGVDELSAGPDMGPSICRGSLEEPARWSAAAST